jgi:hypothetical protein
MNHIAILSNHPVAAPTIRPIRNLFILVITLTLGGVIVWQLRQEWAKNELWPWALFIVTMFVGAFALRLLEKWLPGEPILARVAAFPAQRRRILGAVFIGVALALTGLVVLRLWPDYNNWHETPPFMVSSARTGTHCTWLIGAVGLPSPRAATALTLWSDTRRNRWLEAAAFVLIFALVIFLRTYRFDSIPPGIYA